MNKIQYDLSQALQVITRDLKIRAFLEANDPNALKQAEDALKAEYNEWTVETAEYHAERAAEEAGDEFGATSCIECGMEYSFFFNGQFHKTDCSVMENQKMESAYR